MFEKITVVGPNKHRVVRGLDQREAEAAGDKDAFRANLKKYGMTPTADPEVLWNFKKFLLDKQGEVIARFAPATTPDDPAVVTAIEAALRN